MEISLIESVSPEMQVIWTNAMKALMHHRGGKEFYESQWGDQPAERTLAELIESASLFSARDDKEIIGFVVLRSGVIEGLFVDPRHRRRGVARSLVSYLMARDNAPRDSHVLPGDRTMKSLFESFGWKARLLTMRGE